MTQDEQRVFINELSRRIAAELCAAVDKGTIPPEWDGHELRLLLASRHGQSADMSLLRRYPRSARARHYRNIIATTNL